METKNALFNMYGCTQNIRDHTKTIQVLLERKLKCSLLDEKMWNRDLETAISQIKKELTCLDEIRTRTYMILED